MANASEIKTYMRMPDVELEERLAVEFGITKGVRSSASLSKSERSRKIGNLARRLKARIRSAIRAGAPRIKKITCVNLKYCERRESAMEILVTGIVDATIIEFTLIPMAGLCTYAVKKHLFDSLCECHKISNV